VGGCGGVVLKEKRVKRDGGGGIKTEFYTYTSIYNTG